MGGNKSFLLLLFGALSAGKIEQEAARKAQKALKVLYHSRVSMLNKPPCSVGGKSRERLNVTGANTI